MEDEVDRGGGEGELEARLRTIWAAEGTGWTGPAAAAICWRSSSVDWPAGRVGGRGRDRGGSGDGRRDSTGVKP